MHTLALSVSGHVFSFGNNDECALGRTGTENIAMPVSRLPMGMTDIVAGDSHSIAYNAIENKCYFWGCYRVSIINLRVCLIIKNLGLKI